MWKLLNYGHQISIVGAADINAPTDRLSSGLTYFSRSQGSKCNKKLSYHRDSARCGCRSPQPKSI